MKKKVLFFVMAMVASAFFVPNVHAATPEYYEDFAKGKEIFFANGTPITIEESDKEGYGAMITWEGAEEPIYVTENVGVFGGSHNSTEQVDTSITMNSGTVRNIIGGGLHASSVGTAEIIVNGGTVKVAIYGGGYDGYVWGENENCSCANTNTLENVQNSTVRVDEVIIEVNGGNLDGVSVFGGGGGYNYVGTSTITLNGYEGTLAYLVAGGSNGHTGTADVTVNDGKVAVLQSVNRGTMNSAELLVNGGEVEAAYAGGDSTDSTVDGTIADTTLMVVGGDVASINVGTSGGQDSPASEEATLVYDETVVDESVIENSGFATENVNTTVTFTVDAMGEAMGTEIPKGYVFTDEEITLLTESIGETLVDTNFEFKGYFADSEYTTEFDWTKPIDEDTTLYINIAEIQEKEDETTTEDNTTEEEKVNPDTSDINLIVLIGTILIGTLGLGYTIKNRKFN